MSDVEIRVVAKDQTGPALQSVRGNVDKVSSSFKRMGEIAGGVLLAQGVQAGARRTVAFLQSTVNAAKDLGESVNAVSKIFDTSTGKVIDWGKQNAASFGLSQRAFNQAATPLGAMLKNTGMAMDDVADNTIKLTERAADMASVFNTEVPDALFAIQAALRGETEPIRRYGVSLSEVAIQSKAMAMAGKENAAELTAQEKAAARLALIFEQTADSAGDFKDTSDGLANSQRIATARIEDAKAQIGTAFLPVMAKAAQLTGQLATQFSSLSQPVQIAVAVIAALGAATLIVIPRILALKASLDAAAASGSRAAVGIMAATTAVMRFAPWLVLLDIQKRGTATLTKYGEVSEDTKAKIADTTAEVQEQVKEVQKLTGAWLELHGVQLAADEEMLQAKQAIDAVGESFKENGDKIRGNSDAALQNRIAMQKAAQEAVEAAEAYMENGASAEQAEAMMEQLRKEMVRATGATGKERAEVEKLSKELFALPKTKQVTISVVVDATLKRAAQMISDVFGNFAQGGISGAAGGGPRGGMTWVGEQGPELVRLPYGSTVYPSGQSMAMAQQGGGGSGQVRVIVEDRTSGGIRARAIQEGLARGVPQATLQAAYP